jgi:3-deoxy-manno-octulosonate cytidylyltransferase (CMP-KDO synthetase)
MNTPKKILAVIPVRMSSTRLPGKPLAEIAGKTLVQRVWERASLCELFDKVVVSTDSSEIAKVAESFGAEVVMTGSHIENGSQRVAETVLNLKGSWDVVVNVQGDMPFIDPNLIEQTVRFFCDKKWDCSMATVATPIIDEEVYQSLSDVKVVVSDRLEALYFSRAAVPHSRDGNRLMWNGQTVFGYKHFGLYAFKPEALSVYSKESASSLENIEKLEQLRLIEKGHKIAVCVVDPALTRDSVEVDTPKDLEKANQIANKK